MASGEFDEIADLFLPSSFGAPEALGLTDDAAVIAARPGQDLVVTKDALVAGVHLLADSPAEAFARKLVRTNLSDLAAKGADPAFGFLAVAWPGDWDHDARRRFASALNADFALYGLALIGGDTVATSGPFTASLTLLGYVPEGQVVRRSGGKAGDVVLVSGPIGEGWLGLKAARGEAGFSQEARLRLTEHYCAPRPRLDLVPALRAFASAAADISDGLLADLAHIAGASGLAAELELERMPLSPEGAALVSEASNKADALVSLASGGDDYEIVLSAAPGSVPALQAAAARVGAELHAVGRLVEGQGLTVRLEGQVLTVQSLGYQHGLLT